MNEATQITYGEGTINIIVESDSTFEVAAPEVRLSNYNGSVTAFFNQKELMEIGAGASATVDLKVTMEDGISPSQARELDNAIKEAEVQVGKLNRSVCYYVEATKTVGDAESESMDTFYESTEVQIGIPLYVMKDDREFFLMNDMLGACELKSDADHDADMLVVDMSRAGTYQLLYRDMGKGLISGGFSRFHIRSEILFVGGIVLLLILWKLIDRSIHKG